MAASRKYTAEDYGACRYCIENAGADQRTAVNLTFTATMANRLSLLNLTDGLLQTNTGDLIRLSGLGVKTGREAQRLGIAAIS